MKHSDQSISWPNKIIDLLVVILGVSIAFSLTNWQQDRQSEEVQQHYLRSLQNDLISDQKVLTTELQGLQDQIAKNGRLLRYAAGLDKKTDSLTYFLSAIGAQSTFSPNSFAFQSLVQSGHSVSLNDIDLLRDLTELYHGTYGSIRELEQISMSSFQEHVISRIVAGEAFSPEYMRSPSFQGLVGVLNGFNQQKEARYKQALKQIEHLLSKVMEKIDK